MLPECYELYVCLLMYSVYNCRCPSNICTLFTKPIHGHNTKQVDNNFCVLHNRTASYRNSICVNGIFLWNNLHPALSQINRVKDFKSMLIKLLIDTYSI